MERSEGWKQHQDRRETTKCGQLLGLGGNALNGLFDGQWTDCARVSCSPVYYLSRQTPHNRGPPRPLGSRASIQQPVGLGRFPRCRTHGVQGPQSGSLAHSSSFINSSVGVWGGSKGSSIVVPIAASSAVAGAPPCLARLYASHTLSGERMGEKWMQGPLHKER